MIIVTVTNMFCPKINLMKTGNVMATIISGELFKNQPEKSIYIKYQSLFDKYTIFFRVERVQHDSDKIWLQGDYYAFHNNYNGFEMYKNSRLYVNNDVNVEILNKSNFFYEVEQVVRDYVLDHDYYCSNLS